MVVTEYINLDIVPQKEAVHVRMTQGDTGVPLRDFRIRLMFNGEEIETPSATSAGNPYLEGTKPSGATFSTQCYRMADGTVSLPTTGGLTSEVGEVWCKLVFIDGQSRQSTSGIIVDVEKKAGSET